MVDCDTMMNYAENGKTPFFFLPDFLHWVPACVDTGWNVPNNPLKRMKNMVQKLPLSSLQEKKKKKLQRVLNEREKM
jgi:hypothetical protein